MHSVDESQARILERLEPVFSEGVSLDSALRRISAAAYAVERINPPFDNSAMDGWALRAADLSMASQHNPVKLTRCGEVAAGASASLEVGEGQAARIFTGAPIPAGADTVVMQEDTEWNDGTVSVTVSPPPGKNIRRAGEDLALGDSLLGVGETITPATVALLANQGRSWLQVFRKPVVAILPTGDEILEIDRPVSAGSISNSNAHMLAALVRDHGGVARRLEPAQDTLEGTLARFVEAASGADLILSCGGVSVGEHDHVRDAVASAGELDFWKVAMKPGKPLAFGHFADVPVLGLPGNPVSAFVGFHLFAAPALAKLSGRQGPWFETTPMKLASARRRNRSRAEYIRVRVEFRAGVPWGLALEAQGSGHLSSMKGAEALVEIEAGESDVTEGATVRGVWLG